MFKQKKTVEQQAESQPVPEAAVSETDQTSEKAPVPSLYDLTPGESSAHQEFCIFILRAIEDLDRAHSMFLDSPGAAEQVDSPADLSPAEAHERAARRLRVLAMTLGQAASAAQNLAAELEDFLPLDFGRMGRY